MVFSSSLRYPPPLVARDAATGDETKDEGSPVSLKTPLPLYMTFAVVDFTSISLYNVVELTFIIFTTFKKRTGLYFVSFCVATWGITPYSIGFLLIVFYTPESWSIYGYLSMTIIGWYCTVTGQSVVLYSRLHLITWDKRHLRLILAMIVTNGVILHSATTVMVFGANSLENPSRFYQPYSIMEKVEVTVFFIQELAISLLYISATINFFRHSTRHAASIRSRMLWHLVMVNILVIFLDITILVLEFGGFYKLQAGYKAMSYSIKLKLEFSILNALVNITRDSRPHPAASAAGDCIFDGSRRGNSISALSTTLNTISEVAVAEGSRANADKKKGGFQAMAEYFAYARRASKENSTSAPEGAIMRTTDVSIIHHDASERPMGTLAGTAV